MVPFGVNRQFCQKQNPEIRQIIVLLFGQDATNQDLALLKNACMEAPVALGESGVGTAHQKENGKFCPTTFFFSRGRDMELLETYLKSFLGHLLKMPC